MSDDPTEEEVRAYDRVLKAANTTIRDYDIDAFADGVIAHRNRVPFHENPDGTAPTLRRLSWSLGWNERALARG